MNLTEFAKHMGVTRQAVQQAIKMNRLTEASYSVDNSGKRPNYNIFLDSAESEWNRNTLSVGNNLHTKIAETSTAEKKKLQQQKTVKKNEAISKKHISPQSIAPRVNHNDGSGDFPSINESKEKEAYFNAELKRVKLDQELKNLVSYELVEKIYTNMIIKFRNQIISTKPKFKKLLGAEKSLIVSSELDNILNQFAILSKDDFE